MEVIDADSVSSRYNKGGTAGSKGVKFQVNILTVMLLNAFSKLQNWRLSSENRDAGKFDDIVLEWPGGAIFLQSKYKENKRITVNDLFSTNAKSGDFSLPKYFFSYQEIKPKFPVTNIVICTNTGVKLDDLEFANTQSVDCQSVLQCHGCECLFYTFNDSIVSRLKTKIEEYYNCNLRGIEVYRETITEEDVRDFLEHLQFFYNYPHGTRMSEAIAELLSSINMSRKASYKISPLDFQNKVNDWFEQKRGVYLTKPLVRAMFCHIRSEKFCETLHQYNVLFDNNFILENTGRIFSFNAEAGYLLPVLKIYRTLLDDRLPALYVNPNDGIVEQLEVVEAFKVPQHTVLVLIAPNMVEETAITQMGTKLRQILDEFDYKKVILVTERNNALVEQIGLNEVCFIDGNVMFRELSYDTQVSLLEKKNVVFQGDSLSVNELLAPQRFNNYAAVIDSEMLEKLVTNKQITVGSILPVNNSVEHCYIRRTFKREVTEDDEDVEEETLIEENIYNIRDKMIVIANRGGMGKSTVLSNLATVIKKNHRHLWVIRIELNRYTKILTEFQRQNLQAVNIMQLLNSKEETKLGTSFERFVFSKTRKVVLMLDGVDEVSQDFAEIVLNLLAECQEADNFAKVFVTTRVHMMQDLEEKLQVRPFILQPFTRKDQVEFLTKYWKHSLQLGGASEDKCKRYATALIRNVRVWSNSSSVRARDFSIVPLELIMLGEIFQENERFELPETCEGCREFLAGAASEPILPRKMNMLKLYEIFIEKKRECIKDKGNPKDPMALLIKKYEECLAHQRLL